MNKNEKLKPCVYFGLSTVLAAAVVNEEFCKLLLQDPKTALEQGYREEKFWLTAEETELLLAIQADTLPGFAEAILAFKSKEKPLVR